MFPLEMSLHGTAEGFLIGQCQLIHLDSNHIPSKVFGQGLSDLSILYVQCFTGVTLVSTLLLLRVDVFFRVKYQELGIIAGHFAGLAEVAQM